MDESKILIQMNQYPEEKFNRLVPMETIQELSSMHKIILNTVKVSTNSDDGDVYIQTKGYKDTPDKLALTQKGLSKLMTAAGISVVDTTPITPSTVKNAIEMAKAIGKIVPYDNRDTAHEVTVRVPQPSGGYQYITKSAEMIVEDLKNLFREQKKNMKVWKNNKQVEATEEEKEEAIEKQLTQVMAYRRQQCETKALNRALRTAMNINQTYTEEELLKPFVVAQIVVNPDDPDIKNAIIENYKLSTGILFGNAVTQNTIEAPATSLNALPEGTPDEPEDDNPPIVDAEIVPDPEETPEADPKQEEPIICEKCKKPIVAGSGKWTVENILKWSQKSTNKNLCIDCCNELTKKKKEGGK